ncbi:MAG: hypothetical protein WBW73_26270 [Rhodoplanes sp.]
MSYEAHFTIEWAIAMKQESSSIPSTSTVRLHSPVQRLRTVGLSQRELRRRYGSSTEIIEAGVTFRGPALYDDELCIRAAVTNSDGQEFRVGYTLEVSNETVADGFKLLNLVRPSPKKGKR